MAPTRVLTTVNVSLGAGAIEVGEITGATAVGLDQDGAPITVGAVTWSSETPTIAAVNPATGFIFALAPGSTTISAMTSDGKVGERTLVVKTAPAIRINEVQPKADTPNGWVEFFNPTADAVDLSGWTLIDNNFFGPQYTFPAGSIIQPGGFLVTEETALPFGVDATDDLHLFSRFGISVDAATWNGQPATTVGRCPDGAAAFVVTLAPTKGTPNVCP